MEQTAGTNREKEIKETERVVTDFYTIFLDVIRQWWVILLVGISAAFLTYIGAYLLYQPQYASGTTFVVSAKGTNTGAYANLSQTQRLAEVFKTVLDSQVLKKKVADTLEMDTFPGTVNVAIVPETVTSDSPTTSFRLLDTMLEEYPSVSRSVLGDVVLEVFEDPNYPSAPVESFQGRQVMKQGFLAGAGIMAVLFAVLSFMRDSVKNEKEVKAKLDTGLFVTIYHERKYRNFRSMLRRKKKKLWITEPAVSFGYGETIKKLRTKFLYEKKKRGGQILVVSSVSPQEGKTTVAVNLALALAEDDRKVLLIEGDLRKCTLADTLGLSKEEAPGWGSVAAQGGDLEACVYHMKETGFAVMVNDAKQNRSTEIIGSKAVRDFLDRMREQVDVIIIDAPHVKGRSDAEMWAQEADMSLLVVKQNKSLAQYINDAVDVLDGQNSRLLGCVFNDVPGRRGLLSSGYGYYGHYGKYHPYYRKANRKEEG